MIELHVDTRNLDAAIAEFSKVAKKSAEEITRQQAGIIVGHLIAMTPPGDIKGGAMNDEGRISLTGKKRGEARVAADIARLFPTSRLADGAIYRQIESPQGMKLRTKDGSVTVRDFAQSEEDLARIHKMARSPKTGRTGTGRGGANMAVTRKGLLAAYIKQQKARVGRLNAGWLNAARELRTAKSATPAWITRHPAQAGGAEQSKSVGRLLIRVFNSLPWFPGDMGRRVQYAINRRQRGLEKALAEMLEKQAAKAQQRMGT